MENEGCRLRTYPVGGLDTHRVGVPMGGLEMAITHPWVPISQPRGLRGILRKERGREGREGREEKGEKR
jgi:hypothetical protein